MPQSKEYWRGYRDGFVYALLVGVDAAQTRQIKDEGTQYRNGYNNRLKKLKSTLAAAIERNAKEV